MEQHNIWMKCLENCLREACYYMNDEIFVHLEPHDSHQQSSRQEQD